MNDGWIKMWRKVKDSELFLQDPTAWRVFEYLLMSVDYKTGKYTSGRNRDAIYLRIKPTTFYQALKRLEKKWLSIDIKSNNKFSTILILNWHKYQHDNDTSDDNKMTTNRQQNDTNQEVKNKEVKNNTDTKVSLAKPTSELQDLIDFSKERNFPIQGTIKINRYNASNLLKKFGLEKSKKLVLAAIDCRGKPYAPQVNDFIQLYRKCGDLVNFYMKEKNEKRGYRI